MRGLTAAQSKTALEAVFLRAPQHEFIQPREAAWQGNASGVARNLHVCSFPFSLSYVPERS